jgi:hypothetical protein
MAFEKIPLTRGRQAQLVNGQGNNIFVRASDFNPVLDFLNARLGEFSSSTDNSATGNSVTINKYSGKITTGTLTTAALGTQAITLTNSYIASTSNVIAWVENYSGTVVTNGIPMIFKSTPAAGSATITLINMHSANALNGTVTIKFIVL